MIIRILIIIFISAFTAVAIAAVTVITPSSDAPVQTTVTTVTTNVNPIDDDKIVSAIYNRFSKDSALIGTNLTVSSKNGIVTLDGKVTAQSQADEAVQVAKQTFGVKDVQSSIVVTTNPDTYKSKPPTPNY